MYVSASKNVLSYPALQVGLNQEIKPFYKNILNSKKNKLVVWGKRPWVKTANRLAEKIHRRLGGKVVHVEEGFLRSYDLNCFSQSVVIDETSIYYDVHGPSDLENLIQFRLVDEQEKIRSRQAINFIVSNKLSKYNDFDDELKNKLPKDYVLLFDQLNGDGSIKMGGASEETFQEMLNAALEENPNSQIIIKVHPRASKKHYGNFNRGHYQDINHPRVTLIKDKVNPYTLIKEAKKVYVVSSQSGFEALMAGKEVHCFGGPFYAGWGLTKDRLEIPRRIKGKDLEEIFFCAYILYTKYSNPYTMEKCQIEDTLQLLLNQKQHYKKYAGQWHAKNITLWKRKFLQDFLGKSATISYSTKQDRTLSWAARSTDADLLIEDGFIRSNGLGGKLIAPLSLNLDFLAPYYDCSKQSELEKMISESKGLNEKQTLRAQNVIKKIKEKGISKYNIDTETIDKVDILKKANGRKIALVIGQVESDVSIKHGSPKIKTNYALVEKVSEKMHDCFIIYKPHPEEDQNIRYCGEAPNENHYDLKLTNCSLREVMDISDSVHVMTSLSGMEALIMDKEVHAYGLPFYAGWDLTKDEVSTERRNKKVSLEELFYYSYIEYPTYISPQHNEVCNIETVIKLLEKPISKKRIKPYKSLRSKLAF